jgi:hypothetical protein
MLWLVETAAGCKKAISNNTKIMIDDATYSLLKNVGSTAMQAQHCTYPLRKKPQNPD